ncbi:DNA-3-methyladenine glycosylase 2 [Peribacillus psychrosaccharolyticus]|uniref:DNA-3-methyladenine glycosylase II n=1 Tax=Peribacillus psychrosaccharolyticus TaxID=1407 RepID=A0A974S0U8_PERPY|nr:DNA-3-methyladenine glycosylase [Peribacillus psychrosaccharolyticus]MEC2055843.1 DNA-3-methyladenine glycosylase [Peribacillus psychrosaccharolyticus]MED3743018.1 DNA-3-methyladenine glycosylase [Peribacillus psychrosaccharolyticus]QQT00924.1 DNA-3-methyladenine glycosylase 2 [Peribacillus psychrosaccharolyticus]
MRWTNHEQSVEIFPPKEFNFTECLRFLNRSEQEILHKIQDCVLSKLLNVNGELILVEISCSLVSIIVNLPHSNQPLLVRKRIVAYIWEWFDLDQNLADFYILAAQDKVLQNLACSYSGLRIICIPDLFEALVWAILGQQIHLAYAYTLKKHLVEEFGECLTIEGSTYWHFPSYQKIAGLDVDSLRKYTHTSKKADYIIGIAKAMMEGELTKETLLMKQNCRDFLLTYKGIGPWTAEYVMMKCLHFPSAFPISDVGLHQALKKQLGLERKPTIDETKELAVNWEGWQAYAAFYLWRSLYE